MAIRLLLFLMMVLLQACTLGDILEAPSSGFAAATSTVTATAHPTASNTPALVVTAQPTTAAAPTAASSAVTVINFSVTPSVVNGGEAVTVTWDVSGIEALWNLDFRVEYPGLRFGYTSVLPGPDSYPMPPSGTATITTPEDVQTMRIILLDEVRTVDLRCEFVWIQNAEETYCPAGPIGSRQAAYQPFERGFMVWLNNTVLVFFPNGTSVYFMDTWGGEEIIVEEDPPAGLHQPVRGFGKVWTEHDFIREALGWAVAPEAGYTANFQQSVPFTTGSSPQQLHWVFSLPDARLIYITDYTSGTQGSSSWHFVE